jgi:hypothetical protein
MTRLRLKSPPEGRYVQRPLRTAGLEHPPHQGDRPAPIDHRQTDQTGGIPHQGGGQGHRERLLAPRPPRLLYERTLQGQGINLVVVEPAAKPAPGTLRVRGATHPRRSPCRQVYPTRVEEPPHHPRQGLEGALSQPRGLLAQDKNQRILHMRCVLHDDLPCKRVSQGRILTSYGERGERASLLSVNQDGSIYAPLDTKFAGISVSICCIDSAYAGDQ